MIKLIAHRGAAMLALENTKEAFEIAGKTSGVWGIETDLWLTKDNVWICSHDSNPFENKTIHINQSNYEDIKNLPIVLPKAICTNSNNHFLCTLQCFLNICIECNKVPIIEIKQPNLSKSQIADLLKQIREIKLIKQPSFISFDWNSLKFLKEIDPQIITFQLIDSKLFKNGLGKSAIKKAIEDKTNVSVRGFLASTKLIKAIHENQLLISVWTIDKKRRGLIYQKRNVDFITTNNVHLFD